MNLRTKFWLGGILILVAYSFACWDNMEYWGIYVLLSMCCVELHAIFIVLYGFLEGGKK